MRALGHAAANLQAALAALGAARPSPGMSLKKVLVLGYAAIGDLIFFLPVLEAMRAGLQSKVTFLANAYPTTKELLPATGLVDDIWLHEWEGPAAGDRGAILDRIKAEGFDLAVLTLSSPAHYFGPALARVPLRAGHRRESGQTFVQRQVTGEPARRALLNQVARIGQPPAHALRRNLDLVAALGLPRPDESRRPALPVGHAHRAAAAAALGPAAGLRVGMHIGPPGDGYGKLWPAERFGRLAALLAHRGAEVVALGGAAEEGRVAAARAVFPGLKSALGLGLLESFAAIETCALFVSCDTGLAKAAMALSVPTVTLWGPTSPLELGAVWEPEKHLDLVAGPRCGPRVWLGMSRRGPAPACGHPDCLLALTPEEVFERVKERHPFIR